MLVIFISFLFSANYLYSYLETNSLALKLTSESYSETIIDKSLYELNWLNQVAAPISSRYTLVSNPVDDLSNDFSEYIFERLDGDYLWTLITTTTETQYCGVKTILKLTYNNKNLVYFYLSNHCKLFGYSFLNSKGSISHIEVYNDSYDEYIEEKSPNFNRIDPEHILSEDFYFDRYMNTKTRVCVIDNGFDYLHPSLNYRWLYPFTSLDLAGGSHLPYYQNPHGTHVAGIITMNTENIELIPVRISTNDNIQIGDYYYPTEHKEDVQFQQFKNAIDFCAQNKARIINMSIVYYARDSEKESMELKFKMKNLISHYSDILFVVAAGNEAKNLEDFFVLPASIRADNLITVAAYDDESNDLWYFEEDRGSNFSMDYVDIAANGVLVASYTPNGGFDYFSGTSMAAPKVSSTAAKIMAIFPKLSAKEAKNILLKTSQSIPQLAQKVADSRLLNESNALNYAKGLAH